MAYKNPLAQSQALAEDELSDASVKKIRDELKRLYFAMQPYAEERNREIVRKVKAGDQSDTPYAEEYLNLQKQHKGYRDQLQSILDRRYDRLAQQLGRKSYAGFKPYPNSVPVNPEDPGGSPEITGKDRLYALYEHALRNDLDFGKVLSDDRAYFPERTPDVLEFENGRYNLSKGSTAGDFWKKAAADAKPESGEIKDGWQHVSAGTRYADDIGALLGKENLK